MKQSLITIAVMSCLISVVSYAETSAATVSPSATNTQLNNALSTAAKNSAMLNNPANKTQPNVQKNGVAAGVNNTALPTDTDKVSYALGYDIGHSFKSQNVQLNVDAMAKGIKDGIGGEANTLLSPKEMQDTLLNFQRVLINKRQEQVSRVSNINEKEGNTFLAANKTKPGVVTLADGLQYKVIKSGEGAFPTEQDMVTVNYVGSFVNGQVFDSSYNRGKPSTFPVSQVIPGWIEALKMMKPGAVWEIYVPPSLAYGNNTVGPIGPNQTLIFKIELIAVNAKNNSANISTTKSNLK